MKYPGPPRRALTALAAPRITGREDLIVWLPRQLDQHVAAVGGNWELLRSRRADAVWLDITDRQRPLVEAHEIKVTRADLVVSCVIGRSQRCGCNGRIGSGSPCPPQASSTASCSRAVGRIGPAVRVGPGHRAPAPALTPTAPARRDLPDYVRRNSETRWRFTAEGARPITDRYTVASRFPIGQVGSGDPSGHASSEPTYPMSAAKP